MKKILITLFLLYFSISNSLAYNETRKDKLLLNKIYLKLDNICNKSKNKCKILESRIIRIQARYSKNSRLSFLLGEIINYLNSKNNIYSKIQNNSKNLIKVFCTKIIDGDTIHFKLNNKNFIARLIGIDAPENSTTRYGYTETLGKQAKLYLQKLILNKEIFIEYDNSQTKTDKYGRHLVYIFYNGENINSKIIKSGLAKEYTYSNDYKYKKDFLKSQKYAKKQKKGIWGLKLSQTKTIVQQISNHNLKNNTNCKIKGNINSKGEKIYHLPKCKSYKNTKINLLKGEKYFCSESEAIKAGWRIAGNCH